MNPSTISTPVSKRIDQWHFKFMEKTIVFDVSIKRPRDAQDGDYYGEDGPERVISFEAEPNEKELDKAKVDRKTFAVRKFAHKDINELRRLCQQHCREMLALKWEPVILVGYNNHDKEREDIWGEHTRLSGVRMNPYVEVSFDFTGAQRARTATGDYFRREKDEDDRNFFNYNPDQLLHGYRFDGGQIHIYPYSEDLLHTLTVLKDRYIELNRQIAELIKPSNMPKLMASLQHLLPPAT